MSGKVEENIAEDIKAKENPIVFDKFISRPYPILQIESYDMFLSEMAKETDNPDIASTIKAADEGNWAAFIQLMGGPCTEKKLIPIAILQKK